MVGADRDDVQILPDLLTFRRCAGRDRLVLARVRRRQIVEEHLAEIDRDVFQLAVFRLDAELFRRRLNFVFPFDRHVELAFRCPHQIQNDFAGVHPVLSDPSRGHTAEVARDDQIRVRAAYALRRFRRDPARPHQAVLAADPRDAEVALGLLGVEPVKDAVDAEVVHPAHHFPNGRVRRFFHLARLIREGFLVRRDGLHVVVLIIRVRRVIVFVIHHLRNPVFIE